MASKIQNDKMQVDTALVRELAGLLKETDLSEIEVVDGEKRIRVARQMVAASAVANTVPVALATPSVVQSPVDAAKHPGMVPSPMVGTAYTCSEPGKPAFVNIGSVVKEGDTLIIIEAMKVMNPITAPRAGTVTQIFIANEAPVEYGEPLLVIE